MLISGEPGIGKSRLTTALLKRSPASPTPAYAISLAASHGQRTLSNHCSVERAAKQAHDDTLQASR